MAMSLAKGNCRGSRCGYGGREKIWIVSYMDNSDFFGRLGMGDC